jgi:hypothetical protein
VFGPATENMIAKFGFDKQRSDELSKRGRRLPSMMWHLMDNRVPNVMSQTRAHRNDKVKGLFFCGHTPWRHQPLTFGRAKPTPPPFDVKGRNVVK